MIIATVFIILFFLLFIGMPVAFALGISGLVGLSFIGGADAIVSIFSSVPYRTAASYTLSTVPMFLLMAQFVSASGIVGDVFKAAHCWLERLSGGLAIAAVFASAGVAAMSGSSTAAAATMAAVSIPEMKKHGYSDMVASGVVTVAGTLAIMIPPSIGLVLYGIMTENSIGKMLIAGVIPGFLTAFIYAVGIFGWSKVKPGVMPPVTTQYTRKDRFMSLRPLWAFILLSSLVLGSMYLGIATPTEAAAFGAFGALMIPLVQRKLSFLQIKHSVLRAVEVTTMIFTIIIGAMIFGYFLTLSQATQNLIALIANSGLPSWGIMGVLIIILLFLGCIMDQIAILLITLPLMYPLVISLGYNPIWFGIIFTKIAEIGLCTPPVGMNAFVVSATSKIPLDVVFRGTGRMLLFEAVSLLLLLFIPALSTWLPSRM